MQEERCKESDLLSEQERHRLLVEWNDTVTDYPNDTNLAALFEEQVLKSPHAVAVVYEGESLTYAQLNDRANRLARHLQHLGVKPEQKVGLCVERSLEMIVGLLGIVKAGGAYVPLDVNYPKERLRFMLDDAQISVLVTLARLAERLPAHEAQTVCLDTDGARIAEWSGENVTCPATAESLLYVIFTSGSTGRPKGVLVPHRATARLVKATDYVQFTPDEVFLQVANISFDASTFEIWGSLLNGARLVVYPAQHVSLEELGRVIRDERITTMFLTTALFLQMAEHQWEDLVRVRQLLAGGEMMSVAQVKKLLQKAPDWHFYHVYGPTESTTFATCGRIDRHTELSVSAPIGRPLANTTLYVLDPHMQPVPVGVPGELFIGGAGLAHGYLNRPELTAEKFVLHPFDDDPDARLYRTGDLVRYLPDGSLDILGRIDNQVKIRGFRIELGEIETELGKHDMVRDTVVVVHEEEPGNKQLVAYVVPDYEAMEVVEQQTDVETQADQVMQWEMVFDKIYDAEVEDDTFNTIGWDSHYTGEPIPQEEMREWLDHTITRILTVNTRRVLEIGCGTGMIMYNVLPYAEKYYAVDISSGVLESLHRQLVKHPEALAKVKLLHMQADQINRVRTEGLDLVILNSVVQYFPTVDYLVKVIENALQAIGNQGAIFLGDLRSFPLLKTFHAAVELYRASADLSFETWHQRVQRGVAQDQELVLDPQFFYALQSRLPQISRVEVQLKRGGGRNELTQFRYDVILHVGSQEPSFADIDVPNWTLDWQHDELSLAKLRHKLEMEPVPLLVVQRVPDARIFEVSQALQLLTSVEPPQTVGDLCALLQERLQGAAVEPDDLFAWEKELPYRIEIRPADASGHMEVLFRHLSLSETVLTTLPTRAKQQATWKPLSQYATNPMRAKWMQTLAPLYRSYLAEKLPGYMVPSAFVILEEFPLTPNGKVDRKALPSPDKSRVHSQADFVAPRNAWEAVLADIWKQVLGLEQVGVHDNFFELGGHSLLATQVVSRMRQALDIEFPLQRLFESSTIAEIGERIVEMWTAEFATLSKGEQAVGLEAYLQQRAGRKTESAVELHPLIRRTGNGPVPLSFAQQRLWFLDQLEGGRVSTYHFPSIWSLQGTLRVEVMERCLNEIVRRHEALRTTFPPGADGQPVQMILSDVTLPLPVIDLTDIPESERQAAAHSLIREVAMEPFDLTKDLLNRARLLRLGEQEHILIWTAHHIVTDGWSLGVIERELAALYEAYCAGRPSPLPELPLQYADFALWQRQWLEGGEMEAQLGYWRQKLGGTLPVLPLASDRPRPNKQSCEGKFYHFELPQRLADAIKTFCQQEGVTLYMVMMAAFNTLLYRYTDQDDLLVGTPIANRTRSEVEPLIGFFVNMLVMRNDLSNNPTFRQVIDRVRQVALEAYDHQDVPFEKLVEELQPERDLSQSPLFRVMFSLTNAPSERLQLPGLTMSLMEFVADTARFDLSLLISEKQGGLIGWFDYNSEMFEEATITRMQKRFQTLLEAVVQNPHVAIQEIPLLRAEERDQLLIEWNRTERDYGAPTTLAQQFEAQVERTPDAEALVFVEEKRRAVLTYVELNREANRVAHHLQKAGVGPESRVVICMERSLEMVIAALGVLKAGGAYVPVDPAYPAERIAFVWEDAEAAYLLTQAHLVDSLPAVGTRVLCLDVEAEHLANESDENPQQGATPENAAYVIYTSGSTGTPKGVLVEHRSVCNLLNAKAEQTGIGAGSRVLQLTSFSFDPSVSEIFLTLTTGATLYLSSKQALQPGPHLTALLREQAVTAIFTTPAVLKLLEPEELPALRVVFSGGEANPLELMERWSEGRMFVNVYGPTESTVASTWNILRAGDVSAHIGRPLPNYQTYILDTRMEPVPIGLPGELYLGGAGLARGYLNRPELTAERFVMNPFCSTPGARLYKTGDEARYLPDGNIQFLGRLDDQVKIRGFRIELGELETALQQHPSIREAVVLAREDVPGDKRLVAYVVLQEEQTDALSVREVRAYLEQQLPAHMVPAHFVVLQAMPLTTNDKVDRRALPKPDETNTARDTQYVAPRNRMELDMVRVWEQVLQHSPIGVSDNFFAVGGDSLKSITLMSAIRNRFGCQLPLATLFQTPTVAKLCDHLTENRHEEAPADGNCLALIQQGNGLQPPLFLIHPGWGGVLCYATLASALGEEETVYGIQAVGYESEEAALTSIHEMADRYLEEMVRVAPQGPFRLGGWSMGGIIAFEMAKRLEQRGEIVEFVALIDAPLLREEPSELPFDVKDAKAVMREFARVQLPNADLLALQAMEEEAAHAYLLNEAKTADVYPPGATVELLKRDLKILAAHEIATGRYRCTEPIQANLHLFHVTEVDTRAPHPLVTPEKWQPYTRGTLTTKTVPGYHLTALQPPYVFELAAKMRQVLQRSER